jgi:acid phosphatase (class A)
VEIPLPSSFPAEAIWGSTGRDASGHIWVGVSTRGYGPSAHLLEYAPDTGKFRDRGDVVSELKRAGVWRPGEDQIKIHTKIVQAEDGYLYFASFDEEGESVSRAIKPKWGGHLWRLKPNSDHWEHLRAVPEGMVALAGYGSWIYALGYWDHVLYQYDTKKRAWRSVTVGSVRGHVSRNIVVDLHGHVFVPRAREWRPEEAAAHPMELFSAELVEFDTNLKEVGTTRLNNYIDPHAGRDSHGIIGLAYLANGSIVVSTHRGYLYRITPANSGAAKVEGLGWIYPNGPSYAASLFPVDGERYLAAVTTVEGAPAQWVVYDLRTRQGRARPLPFEIEDPLLYGTSTRDDKGRLYVVGWQKNLPHGHKPIMLQIDMGLVGRAAESPASNRAHDGSSEREAMEWINRIPLKNIIPPPPPRGSRIEQNEISEIHKARAAATPEQLAQAKLDNDIEDATIFAAAIGPGWDLKKLPKTKFLVDRIMDIDRAGSRNAKHYFLRDRPYIVDPKVQTCAPHDGGHAPDSYPSGHTMLGYELGVVLASLMPNRAQAILARAHQYGENRIVCGFHFRSDVTAGQQFGTVLAGKMMQHPAFGGWLKEAQAELKAAGLAH